MADRQEFVKALLATDLEKTWFLTADVGYGVLEPLQEKLGQRFVNMGCREQLMIAAAAGIASCGYRVFCYSFAPFVLVRPAEQIRDCILRYPKPLDICLVGVQGRKGGPTHYLDRDELRRIDEELTIFGIRGNWAMSRGMRVLILEG